MFFFFSSYFPSFTFSPHGNTHSSVLKVEKVTCHPAVPLLTPRDITGTNKKKEKKNRKKVSLQQEFSKRATWRTLHSVDVGANLFPHKLQCWLNWLLGSSSLNHAGYLIDNGKNSRTGDDRCLSGWKWLEIIKMFFFLTSSVNKKKFMRNLSLFLNS